VGSFESNLFWEAGGEKKRPSCRLYLSASKVQALALLCHVPSIGSCSQFCLILQPHRVAVPFPPTFASPWRNSFVQIHGGKTLLKAKFGTTPQKRPENDINWGVGSSYGTNNPPFQIHSFESGRVRSMRMGFVEGMVAKRPRKKENSYLNCTSSESRLHGPILLLPVINSDQLWQILLC